MPEWLMEDVEKAAREEDLTPEAFVSSVLEEALWDRWNPKGKPGRKPWSREKLEARAVRESSGCLVWQGAINSEGYGTVWHRDRTKLAHRLMWELTRGPVPEGLEVMHTCDVRACIAVDHLQLGTHAENLEDAKRKGRIRSGDRHWTRDPSHPSYGLRGRKM